MKLTFRKKYEQTHTIGDTNCEHCYKPYPKPHECGTGLLHQYKSTDLKGHIFITVYECDGCGMNWEERVPIPPDTIIMA